MMSERLLFYIYNYTYILASSYLKRLFKRLWVVSVVCVAFKTEIVMDPSKIYGGHHAEEEECQSSESGWTMYLGSRLDGENDHHDSDDDHHDGKTQGHCHKDDSDDSMVSDASSRPSAHQRSRSSVHARKQEEKAKTKKQSASGAARMRRDHYSKAAEKKARILSSKANK